MGFDGAAIFSGERLMFKQDFRNMLHMQYLSCHLLQLACVQAASNTTGIKRAYNTLTTLWKYFPKRAESLKCI